MNDITSVIVQLWWMVCTKCRHTWPETMPLPMPARNFTRRLDRLHCPECDANNQHIAIKLDTKEGADARS